jgi:two-component system chemotaxis response regulator CheY
MFEFSIRVLVIDDMLTMRKIVAKCCKEIGFKNLIEASDGMRGWEQLTTSDQPVGLIISDWNMPNCSGLELLKKVRGDSRYKGVPFVLLTAESESKQVVEAVQAGVDNYIVKPFTADGLRAKLEDTHKKVSKR